MKSPPQERSRRGGRSRQQQQQQELVQIDNLVGSSGRYQFLIFMFKILIGATSSYNNLGVTFFAPTGYVGYSCADNSTADSSGGGGGGGISDLFVELVAGTERSQRHNNPNFTYATPGSLMKNCTHSVDGQLQQQCNRYVYDKGIWISTIIDEWDLVCDRSKLISFIQSLYMSGFIVAFLVFGYLSDRYGRWRTLLLGAIMEVTFGLGCALSSSAHMFMVFRFLLGFGCAGRSASSYLHLIEWVGPKWRMPASIFGSLGWVVGYCLLPWICLYFLHFRHMQLFVCFYEMIFIVWILFLPESPRWLLTHKRFDEAHKVLLRAAKFNGLIKKSEQTSLIVYSKQQVVATDKSSNNGSHMHKVSLTRIDSHTDHSDEEFDDQLQPDAALQPYTIEEFEVRFQKIVQTIQRKDFTRNENKLSIIDLFKWKNLRRYAMIICFIYGANSLIYYGISLNAGDFGGSNLFVSFTIAGLAELPGMAFALLCMKLLPRKTANLFIFLTTGLLCALQLPLKFFNYQMLQQATMMIAKLFNTSSFEVIRYQSMELFPTSIRQTAHSSFSLAGRIGSILAPFVGKELPQVTNSYVPPSLYACLYLLNSLLIRGIPETKGSDFSDTLLEAENFQGTTTDAKRQRGKENSNNNRKDTQDK